MRQQFVLFDFDGVIADSFQASFEVQQLICPHVTLDQYRRRFEGNINEWEEPMRNHTNDCRRNVDFFDIYIPKMKQEVQIVPGMKEVIQSLQQNYRLIVISSTITSPIQDFLEKCNLADQFTLIMGNDVHTSKVEKIKIVFEKQSCEPNDCVFITDTLGDMHEASRMGVRAIGTTWGFHAPETLQRGNPFRLVHQPNDLLDAVPEYFAAMQ